MDAGRAADRLKGSRGEDRLKGNRGNDYLWGGQGNDKIIAGEDNDKVYAGYGDVLIYARDAEGEDYIDCGEALTRSRPFTAMTRPSVTARDPSDLVGITSKFGYGAIYSAVLTR